jgi:hypothetical protein
LQPGLTIGDILDILVRDSTLADFLGQLCWCDVAAIQQQPRGTFEQLLVYPSLRAERAHEGGVPATHLLLEKAFDLRIPLPEGGGLPARYQAIADFLNVSTVPDDPNVEVAQLPADLRYRFLAARDDVPFRTGIASFFPRLANDFR